MINVKIGEVRLSDEIGEGGGGNFEKNKLYLLLGTKYRRFRR